MDSIAEDDEPIIIDDSRPVDESTLMGLDMDLLRRKADRLDPDATAFLGFRYIAQLDVAKAVQTLHKAATLGHKRVAELFIGKEAKVDPRLLPYVTRLATEGKAESQLALGLIYRYGFGVDPDLPRAFEWMTKAAEQGDAEAQQSLAGMYTGKDDKAAVNWYHKAAEQGKKSAQLQLSNAYFVGFGGVPKDFVKSYMWYILYAEGQPPESPSHKKLEDMKLLLKPEQVAEAEKLVAAWVKSRGSV